MKSIKVFLSLLFTLFMICSLITLPVKAVSLKIVTQPKTTYTAYGEYAKATIKASGEGLKYAWYFKNEGASKYTKSSNTKATYSVKMSDSIKNRKVYCIVQDQNGASIKSNIVTLKMKATITTQPKTTYAQQGSVVKVNVKAKGDGLNYTWYLKNVGSSKYSKSSKKSSTYSVTMNDNIHNRLVYCVVSDQYGKSEKSKAVALRQAATIITQPKSVLVAKGEKAKVSVKAVGEDLTYAWYYKNPGSSKYTKSSVSKSTYSITMNDTNNGRFVYCIVTDKYGKSEKSKTVSLKQKELDPLLIELQPTSTEARIGDQVGFMIKVSGGTAPYQYRLLYTADSGWKQKDAELLKLGDNVEFAFFVDSEIFSKAYSFCIEVKDANGQIIYSDPFEIIQIDDPFRIDAQPINVIGRIGDQVTNGLDVCGGVEPYSYQWQYRHIRIPWTNCSEEIVNGANSKIITFTIVNEHIEDLYQFRCIVTDSLGEVIISDIVQVEIQKY